MAIENQPSESENHLTLSFRAYLSMINLFSIQNPWRSGQSVGVEKTVERALLEPILPWMERREMVTVFGPRQAGKTTLLFQIIGRLLRSGVDPKCIFYFSLDDYLLRDRLEADPRALLSFLESESPPSGRRYLFLDEIQKAPRLLDLLKMLHDFRKVKMVLSGCSTMEIQKKLSESLLGRTISFVLLPFSFTEYLKGTAFPFQDTLGVLSNL